MAKVTLKEIAQEVGVSLTTVHRVLNGKEGCGCLGLWAFGSSRVLDVLAEIPQVDAGRISVAGHSRGGHLLMAWDWMRFCDFEESLQK